MRCDVATQRTCAHHAGCSQAATSGTPPPRNKVFPRQSSSNFCEHFCVLTSDVRTFSVNVKAIIIVIIIQQLEGLPKCQSSSSLAAQATRYQHGNWCISADRELIQIGRRDLICHFCATETTVSKSAPAENVCRMPIQKKCTMTSH
eukprot:scaffold4428_cov77-Skeletonema_dohrnii-CCMP3373.AAC.2